MTETHAIIISRFYSVVIGVLRLSRKQALKKLFWTVVLMHLEPRATLDSVHVWGGL